MSAITAARGRAYIPLLVTSALLISMFGAGSVQYDGFFSGQVLLNLLIDNAFLLVVAVGMTFVVLTGGIDLSVGAMVALSTMVSAWLVEQHGWPPLLVIPLVLAVGTGAGLGMGWVIHSFEIQPFIVTLAGMFLARGLCYTISIDSISLTDPAYTAFAQTRIPLPGGLFVSPSVLIAVGVLVIAFVVLHYTRLGRNVYALGGSEQSARLMGLPAGRTKMAVYAVSGFCSALGGVLLTFYMLSGYGLHAVGLELDAIAAVVIGGTLLTGGSGYLLGTALGVLVLGLIQTVISFQGTLSSWWTRIVVGGLLFVFILLQRLIAGRREV
ncbi:galactofuranose ABC transporter, permease protein YjfF [Streptomyces sp. NPDC006326]|uniref:galactofuranose ABC transporter, permease protein YjfF n=1 Tax=Streptomyces sp. NPDC006326 TaxID=3156752 RepID=UPI0033ADD3C8